MIFKKQASEQQHFARKCCCFFVRSFLKHTIFTPKAANKNAGADIIRPFLYEYNPISFGKPKETGLRPERKVFYPLLFAPANAVPFQKGTKTHHRQDCGFQSRPLPLGVGNGFHFIFLAQPYYRRQKRTIASL
ncbi:MAG: hypothetical protein J6C34_04590 [Oscillospiraceae bacterium]|nr:hypothetical protein [Oscillospiraceae bacterium]MBQ8594417.1 hypothetical protein [Oscillospiraceae bacterium]